MRRFLLGIGLTVVTVAAVVASFSTLASLAVFTGWGQRSSWLLPASLDALGMTACLVWLNVEASAKARRYACWLTWTAAGLSILGNGAGHLASTGHLAQGLLLVVLVGAVPPAALATTVHLIVLVSSSAPEVVPVPDAAPVPAAKPVPSPVKKAAAAKPKPSPKPVLAQSGPESGPVIDEVRMQKARHMWDERGGISRDTLKEELRIGTKPATDLLNALKKEKGVA